MAMGAGGVMVPITSVFDDKGTKDAARSLKGLDTAVSGTAAVFDKMAKPAAGALGAVSAGMVTVGKAATEAAMVNKNLKTSFENVGWDKNAKAATEFADALSKQIAVEDEVIKSTITTLTAYDSLAASSDLMARVTTTSADMAAKGFGTMDSSAKLLGRALEDPTKGINALFRAGVTFTDQQKEQIKTMQASGDMAGAQAILLAEAEKTFSGAAKANKTAGQDAKVAWGEAQEALGEQLIPAFEKFLEILVASIAWIDENSAAVAKVAKAIAALSAAVLVINAAFKIYNAVGMISKVVNAAMAASANKHAAATTAQAAATGVATKATKVFGIVSKSAMGWIGLLIGVIVAAAVVIIKNWESIEAWTLKVWGNIKSFLQGFMDWIKGAFDATMKWLENVVKGAWNAIKKILSFSPFGIVLTHLDQIKAWFRSAMDWIQSKVTTVWNAVKGVFKSNPFAPVKAFLDSMKKWFSDAFDWIKDKCDGFMRVVNNMVDGIQKAFKKSKDIVNKIVPGKKSVAVSSFGPSPFLVSPAFAAGLPTQRAVASQTSGGGGVTINIDGALDPEGVARQIRKILDSHDRRQGRTVVRAVAF